MIIFIVYMKVYAMRRIICHECHVVVTAMYDTARPNRHKNRKTITRITVNHRPIHLITIPIRVHLTSSSQPEFMWPQNEENQTSPNQSPNAKEIDREFF